ncbi:hypothetical protein [Peribacillus butanolivorans]|uniref:hypothetical protein n=1 Tax=Peribacillus butanolivorans TaxID=421767 RepID=UPI0036D87321
MNLQELLNIYEQDEELIDDRIKPDTITEVDGELYSVNGHIALPIEEIASFYDLNTDIEIVDESGEELGTICFSKHAEVVTELTNLQLISYIKEISPNDFESGKVVFNKSYVVLKVEKYQLYKEHFYNTAPVWGNFSHLQNTNIAHKVAVTKLEASKVKLPTEYHKESIIRAIQQPYGFERFLKTYHMLELLFDTDFVEGINQLGQDLKGIGKLVQNFNNKDEIERLRQVVYRRSHTINLVTLASLLNRIKSEKDLAIEIFFEYGKEKSNPISKTETKSALERFNSLLQYEEPFQYENVHTTFPNIKDQEKYRKFLVDISTYWIYRVRCSIAHSKIGEYILKSEDEKFVVEIIEPILKCLITECFAINES